MSMIKPAVRGVAVTPSDTEINAFRVLYVGTGGSLTLVLKEDTEPTTFANVPSGSFFPSSTLKVMATGTTCADIIGLL